MSYSPHKEEIFTIKNPLKFGALESNEESKKKQNFITSKYKDAKK